MTTFATYLLWIVTYSFFGWLYESILCSVAQAKVVNRGFLNGPVCPVYGFGAALIIAVLGRGDIQDNTAALFLSGAMLTCTLEYITSWAMEKLFHARWWDYSERKFQINGRVCLEGAVVFGLFSVVLIKWIHPAVSSFYARHLTTPEMLFISGGMMSLFALDTFVTVKHILEMNGRLEKMQAFIEKSYGRTEERLERFGKMREELHLWIEREADASRIKLKFQDRRLLNAFPKMKSLKYYEALESVKEFKEKIRAEKHKR